VPAFLQDKKVVNKLVDKLAPLFKKRKGGFTRIIRLGERKGDRAMMVRLELIAKTKKPSKEKKKSQKKEKKLASDRSQERKSKKDKLKAFKK